VKMTLAAGLLVATASAATFAQAPAGSSSTPSTAPQQQRQTPQSPQQNSSSSQTEQTITGCLTAAGAVYTLTVMDDSGSLGSTAETTAYTLAPGSGVDLQPHVNKRVTVKGTDAGPQTQDSARVVETTPPAPAATGTSGTSSSGANGSGSASAAGANGSGTASGSGTANGAGSGGGANAGAASSASANRGGATPTVQTTAKARINAKTLNVTNVAPATGTCGAQ
jgi:hypothetical protein